MCTTRVGKVLDISGRNALIEFFDGRTSDAIDISMVEARVGSYVEVFGNLALSLLSEAEAKKRRLAWKEIMKAAGVAT